MKRSALLLMLLSLLILTGCVPWMGGDEFLQATDVPYAVKQTKTPNQVQQKNTPRKTAAPTAEPAVEQFQEDGKNGLRSGKKIIADAIWDSIRAYSIAGKQYYRVELKGLGTAKDRYGLIDGEGNMLIEPAYQFMVPAGDYMKCRKDDGPYLLIDVSTLKTVFQTRDFISDVRGHYAITHTSASLANPIYKIHNIQTGKILYSTGSSAKDVSSRYDKDLGFVMTMTVNGVKHQALVSFSGNVLEGTSVQINKEVGLIFAAVKRQLVRDGYVTLDTHYQAYTFDLEKLGDFTIKGNSLEHLKVNSLGHTYVIADAMTPVDHPGYIFFDITDRIAKPIPGAVKVHGFSDGMAIVKNSQGKYGYINDQGDLVYGYQFDDAENFENGKAQAVKNYKKVIIDKKGDDRDAVYQEACTLMDNGQHDAAYQLFISIPDYKDVPEKLSTEGMLQAARRNRYKPGSTVEMGDYYGKITWIVLGNRYNNQVLMISRDILDFKEFHDDSLNNKMSAPWAETSIKSWLNSQFKNEAFSAAEQEKLIDTGIGSVFLLSKEEVEACSAQLKRRPDLTAHARSARAAAQKSSSSSVNLWLLRNEKNDDVHYTSSTSVTIMQNGRGLYAYSDRCFGIRPAILVDINNLP